MTAISNMRVLGGHCPNKHRKTALRNHDVRFVLVLNRREHEVDAKERVQAARQRQRNASDAERLGVLRGSVRLQSPRDLHKLFLK